MAAFRKMSAHKISVFNWFVYFWPPSPQQITSSFCYFLVQPAGWELKKEWLPDGWLCLVCLCDSNIFHAPLMPGQPIWLSFYIFWKVCGASDTQDLPPNFIKLAKDAYTPDLMAASDCMLGNNNFKLFGVQGYLTSFLFYLSQKNPVPM